MSTLQERLVTLAPLIFWNNDVINVHGGEWPSHVMREAADALDAAEAKLAAIDALLLTASNGPNDPEYQWLLNEAYRILHPEEGSA